MICVFALPHPGLLPSGEGEIAGRFEVEIAVPGKLSARRLRHIEHFEGAP
jgi:hypothetical protein